MRDWMRSGFMKPGDLAKKAKITEKNLVYLPFWVVSAEATTKYKGIFERISPAIVKEGQIQKEVQLAGFSPRSIWLSHQRIQRSLNRQNSL